MTAPVNSDVSSAWMIPGVYIQLDLTGAGANLSNIQSRSLLVGYKTSAGTAAPDTPVLVTGQSLANQYGGRGSELARMFAAFQAQVGGGQADVFLLPIAEPSGGTAATRLITFDFSTGSSAAAQDSIDVFIAGYKMSALVASGDTATVIGASVRDAINANLDLPVTATASSGVVTLTARTKGLTGEDLPVIVNVPNSSSSKIRAAAGTVTYATNATGNGSATVSVGGTTYTAAITSGDTPSVVATAVGAAINAASGPVTASVSSAVVTLYYETDRVVQRPSAAIVTSTGITATVAAGTAGAGTPTLTNALAVVAAQSAFGFWATSFNDATSLGTMATHIEAYANGLYQKDQFLWFGSTDPLATAGAIPAATTPSLTSSVRYHEDWCMDSPQQAYELAARHAAMVCVNSFKAQNYDGAPLQSLTPTVPLLLPHRNSRPSPADVNSAMRSYYMTPLVVDESANKLTVCRGRTTSSASDERLWDTSLGQVAGYIRYDMNSFLRTRFKQKSIKQFSKPRTPNTINIDDVKDAITERLFAYDGADFLDGAEQLKAAVAANINVLSPSRIDAYIPFRPPVPLHIMAPVLGLV